MKKVRFLIALLSLLLLFCACAKLPTLKPTGKGDYKRSDNGTHYREAPLSYLVTAHLKEAVATVKDKAGERSLYSVGNDFLCDDAGNLYLPDGVTLPASLEAFAPQSFSICKEEKLLAEVVSSRDALLIDSILHAADADEIPAGFSQSRYLLIFFAPDYPGLCYRLEYLVFQKGEDPYGEWDFSDETCGFLYDREQNNYKIAPNALYELLTGGNS
ncbi:MAG: hypothetical protein IJR88_05660 [Clostridia bacterium]|nr:hypothetical protein [Clostridia bacterium]